MCIIFIRLDVKLLRERADFFLCAISLSHGDRMCAALEHFPQISHKKILKAKKINKKLIFCDRYFTFFEYVLIILRRVTKHHLFLLGLVLSGVRC
jgi:hypothetical protein